MAIGVLVGAPDLMRIRSQLLTGWKCLCSERHRRDRLICDAAAQSRRCRSLRGGGMAIGVLVSVPDLIGI